MTGPIFDFEEPFPFRPQRAAKTPPAADEGLPGRMPVCQRCAWPALARVTDLMNGRFFDLTATLAAIIDTAIAITRAQRGCLLLYSEEEGFHVAVARGLDAKDLDATDFRPSFTLIKRVRERGDAICVPNLYKSPYAESETVLDFRILAVMCAPLILKSEAVTASRSVVPSLAIPSFGGILGVLYVDSRSATSGWSDALLDVFQALSDTATIAIINARLFESYRKTEEQKLAFNLVRHVQEKLLPAAPPRVSGLEIVGWNKSCETAGGDYFDYLPLAEDRLALVIGDVSGRGVGSALLMATVRAVLLTVLEAHSNPGEVLMRLNHVVHKEAAGRFFVTLFLGILDPRTRRLAYVNAGHDSPSLYRAAAGAVERLPGGGIALGLIAGTRYDRTQELQLEDGDVLLAATDGMWTVRDPAGDELGRDALDTLLAETHADSAADILEIVRHAALFHMGNRAPQDDMTALVCKVGGGAATRQEDNHLVAGLAALRVEDYDRALAEFDRAIAAGQNPDYARFYLGLACCDKGLWARARGEFLTAQKLNAKLPNLDTLLKLAAFRSAGG